MCKAQPCPDRRREERRDKAQVLRGEKRFRRFLKFFKLRSFVNTILRLGRKRSAYSKGKSRQQGEGNWRNH